MDIFDEISSSSFSETDFQEWYKKRAKIAGINQNPDDPRQKYDYRAAYMAGVEPEINKEDGLYHWPSEFKADDHPNRFVNGIDTKYGTPINNSGDIFDSIEQEQPKELTPLQQHINRKTEEYQTGRPIPQLTSSTSQQQPLKSMLPEKIEVQKSLGDKVVPQVFGDFKSGVDYLKTIDAAIEPISTIELGLNLISSTYGTIGSGLAGLLSGALTGGNLEKARNAADTFQKYTIYPGITKLGREKIEAAQQVMGAPKQVAESFVKEFIDAKKHPNLAATIDTAITGAPAIAMLKDIGNPTKRITNKINNAIDSGVRGYSPFYKAGKYTPKQFTQYLKKSSDAIREIVALKDVLKYEDQYGNVSYGLPKNTHQFAQAITQVKDLIFERYDSLAKKAKIQGAKVDLNNVNNALKGLIEDKVLIDNNPGVVEYATQLKKRYTERGSYDPVEAQRVIAGKNVSLQRYEKTGAIAEGDVAFVDKIVAESLREDLDRTVSNLTGEQYAPLKKKYGSVRAIENDVMGSLLKSAKKSKSGKMNYADLYAIYHATKGALNVDPTTMIASGALEIGKFRLQRLKDPDLIVNKMFSKVDKYTNKLESVSGYIKARNSANEYLKSFFRRKDIPVENLDKAGTEILKYIEYKRPDLIEDMNWRSLYVEPGTDVRFRSVIEAPDMQWRNVKTSPRTDLTNVIETPDLGWRKSYGRPLLEQGREGLSKSQLPGKPNITIDKTTNLPNFVDDVKGKLRPDQYAHLKGRVDDLVYEVLNELSQEELAQLDKKVMPLLKPKKDFIKSSKPISVEDRLKGLK